MTDKTAEALVNYLRHYDFGHHVTARRLSCECDNCAHDVRTELAPYIRTMRREVLERLQRDGVLRTREWIETT